MHLPTPGIKAGGRVRLPRPTIRLRLTLLYGALFLASGALLLAITFVLVRFATGNPIVGTSPDGAFIIDFSGPIGGQTVIAGGAAGSGPGIDAPPQLQQLQALVIAQHAAELNQLLLWSGVALVIMAAASIGIGWLVAGRVLRPVRSMTADVRAISAADLRRRLTLPAVDDELRDLGSTFNDLLGRLERSFDAQRQFVANASHELRTPLARQRTLIQVAMSDPDATVNSLRATYERVLVAETQQEELIEALLTLARGERGLERHESVDLAVVAQLVLDARRTESADATLRVQARLSPARTSGDRRLLERLVANLIDNAVRYNVPRGQIEVTTETRGGIAVLRVTNGGPVVPAADVERLFQPFQRLGLDRTDHGERWGLGLSIVRAIASAHEGSVRAVAREGGGLVVEVSLPTMADPMSAVATTDAQ